MLPSMLAAHLGMSDPAPKGTQPAKGTGDAGVHLNAALAAHKKGDHKTAKKHALKAVNVLHRSSPSVPVAPPVAPAGPAVPSAPSAA